VLKVGDKAPSFEAKATDGRTLSTTALHGKPFVMYFFPKAFTGGCTIETKRFRDSYPELQGRGAEVIGVSTDDHQTQCDFAASAQASFPMIGDKTKEICRKFGVLWPILGLSKRVTFVVDAEGVIRGVFAHEIRIEQHIADVRALLETLPKPAATA
jgi:peroxiredoxin Q/BCP